MEAAVETAAVGTAGVMIGLPHRRTAVRRDAGAGSRDDQSLAESFSPWYNVVRVPLGAP
jgi:hypothetical protein